LTDGGPNPVQVWVWVPSYRVRPVRLVLTLDSANAERVRLIGRWRLAGVILAVVAFLAGCVGLASLLLSDVRWTSPALLALILTAVGGAFLVFLVVTRSQPAIFPVATPRGNVVLRQVDEAAAAEWVKLNPGRGIRLVDVYKTPE
jgi:hypothetical protein